VYIRNAIKEIDLNQLPSLLLLLVCDLLIKFTSTATELRCHRESSTETPKRSQGCTSDFPHVALTRMCSTTAQDGDDQHASSTAVKDIKPHIHPSVLFPGGEAVIAHEPFQSISR